MAAVDALAAAPAAAAVGAMQQPQLEAKLLLLQKEQELAALRETALVQMEQSVGAPAVGLGVDRGAPAGTAAGDRGWESCPEAFTSSCL